MLARRSAQTHPLSLPGLSSQWVFQQYRRAAEQGEAPGGVSPDEPNKSSAAAGRKKSRKTARAKAEQTREQRAGHGGAWRAWLRLRSRKFAGMSMKEMADDYIRAKRDNTNEYKKAQRMGAAATAEGKRSGMHGFGGTKAQARRSKQSLRHACLALQFKALDDNQAGKSLALAAFSRCTDATLADTLSVARRVHRIQRRQERDRLQEGEQAVSAYRSSQQAAQVLRAVQQALPELAGLPMVPEPSSYGDHLVVQMPGERDLGAAVDWANANSQTSGLATRLEHHWDLLHQTIMHDSCPPVEKAASQTPCFLAGVCVCSDEGKIFHRVVNRFLEHIKAVCPYKTQRRDDLANGCMIVRLIGRPLEYGER